MIPPTPATRLVHGERMLIASAPSQNKVPVSVLVLTYNEEANLPRCLESVRWADDVVVLDSYSTDGTVEVARAHGARVVQRRFDTFADQRNYGVDHSGLRHEWVLHLDADEVVTPELQRELTGIVRGEGEEGAYRLASRMMFQGRWLRYAGMYPAYQVRFGRRDALRFVQIGHGQRETLPAEAVGTLKADLEHYSFSKGLHDWFEKHNRYSSDEALEAARHRGDGVPVRDLFHADRTTRRRAVKALAARLPSRPTLRFVYMYVLRGGFLDGRAGYAYCRLLAAYEFMTVVKEREVLRLQRLEGGTDAPARTNGTPR